MQEISRNISRVNEIEIHFLNPIDADHLRKAIKNIEIQNIKEGRYLVRTATTKDIRADLFDYAVASNNKLLEMKTRTSSLEHVFKSVTKS
jgi:hypothetical protein